MRMTEPSERNFEIFYSVETEGLSLRKAAEKWRLSVVRIQQILEQTRKWYVANTPDWVLSLAPGEQVLVACRMYGQRLSHLRSQAMEAWQASQTPQTIRREVAATLNKPACIVNTTKSSYGQAQYLTLTAKLCDAEFAAAQRMAVALHKWQAKAAAPVQEKEIVEQHSEVTTPCALDEEILAEAEEIMAEVLPLTADTLESCDETLNALMDRSLLKSSVQTPVRAELEARFRKRQKRKERHRSA